MSEPTRSPVGRVEPAGIPRPVDSRPSPRDRGGDAGGGVLLMALNTIANVVGRFVLQSSIFFTEELNRILIVLITFAGISYAARHGRHIRMSAIFDTLPPSGAQGDDGDHRVVTAVFMLGLAWYSAATSSPRPARGGCCRRCRSRYGGCIVWVPVGFFMTGHPIRADGGQEPDAQGDLALDLRAGRLR